jgi:glutathione synthase/RimK-type ligase-like ATP-grasp enzyme
MIIDATPRRRVLLCATTTGYQTRMFDVAAQRLGIDLVLATDRCDHLEDPWRDRAIAVRFHDEAASLDAVREALGDRRLDGVLAVGDRPVVLAALVAEALGVPWHPVEAARASRDTRLFRECLRAACLPAPWSLVVPANVPGGLHGVSYPCVVKPLVLSGSRGVIRADDAGALASALARVARLLQAPDVRALRDPAGDIVLV